MKPIDLTSLPQDNTRKKIPTASSSKPKEIRMQIRWGDAQLQLLKDAAEIIGIPYQTYVKQTMFEHASALLAKHHAQQKEGVACGES